MLRFKDYVIIACVIAVMMCLAFGGGMYVGQLIWDARH